MTLTINSRALNQEITFSRPGTSYVYADLNGQPGTLGRQICEAGRLTGSTIVFAGDSANAFRAICVRWYRGYLRNLR